jgi:predicted deacetylase
MLGTLKIKIMAENNVYGIRCTKCLNTPCSCEIEKPFYLMKWWRKNIVEEMTRKELEDRVVEYHEEIHRLRNELSKLNEK